MLISFYPHLEDFCGTSKVSFQFGNIGKYLSPFINLKYLNIYGLSENTAEDIRHLTMRNSLKSKVFLVLI